MGAKLSNAPVFFTIGQVQHNPLLSLESYVPLIQESMRKAGYPAFRKTVRVALNLASTMSGESSSEAASERVEIYQFANIKETSGFAMTANALSFQTTDYENYPAFWAELRHGIEVLDSLVGGLSFAERLGLRYVDAVMPRDGEPMSDYLVPELLGLSTTMRESLFAYSFSESMLVSEGCFVKSRTIIQHGKISFPPDVQTKLKMLDRFNTAEVEHAIIDTDSSYSERLPFDLADIEHRMDRLHSLASDCFKASVTAKAQAVWESPREAVNG